MKDVDSSFPSNEHFAALVYKKTTNNTTEVEAQYERFVKDVGNLEQIPPT